MRNPLIKWRRQRHLKNTLVICFMNAGLAKELVCVAKKEAFFSLSLADEGRVGVVGRGRPRPRDFGRGRTRDEAFPPIGAGSKSTP